MDEFLGFDPDTGRPIQEYPSTREVYINPINLKPGHFLKLATKQEKIQNNNYLGVKSTLFDYLDNPTNEKYKKLQSMRLSDVATIYKFSNEKEKQLIKHGIMKNNLNSSVSGLSISRFNSPVVKLDNFEKKGSYLESVYSSESIVKPLSSLNTFIQNLVSKSNHEMDVIEEDYEDENCVENSGSLHIHQRQSQEQHENDHDSDDNSQNKNTVKSMH